MSSIRFDSHFQTRLIDGLYAEAMILAEAARSYFDGVGRDEREGLNPVQRVCFSCESLKVTTRLMHVLAWVLTQRAVDAGELDWTEATHAERRLGRSPESDPHQIGHLPSRARRLTLASLNLYRRVERLDHIAEDDRVPISPVRQLQDRLSHAF
ncbi:DUF1465 family protein [Sphingomonas sp. Leaf21]|jgi:regulator of CtrA degradation|uniref:DUF1465 family protein n=1 Tax=Sphingomonas sp. Leaf21 TaxID=2876550 RepID=UPI001E572974|nr:DUF1465 family protein [Sphingomonas sp. Leaf21]